VKDQLIVYSPQDNSRLTYVLDYLLVEQCGLSYLLTDDREATSKGKVINYSAENFPKALNINYSLYLNQLIGVPDFDKELSFDNQSTSNFDCLAAIFYLLARVEEYESSDLDTHGRYQARSSILYKKQLLAVPVVDLWIKVLKKQLTQQLGLQVRPSSYSFLSTIDVDQIYAYKNKPLSVKTGAFFRDVLKLDWTRIIDRLSSARDPYDRLGDMLDWHRSLQIDPIFFVLTAQRSTYDKSLAPSSIRFIEKIAELGQQAALGIHPSYASNTSSHILKKEKNDLVAIVGRQITKSRQHYLKLSLPTTYHPTEISKTRLRSCTGGRQKTNRYN